MRLTRSVRFIALALVGVFLLAGCGGDDGGAGGQGGGSDAANVAREDVNIIYVLPATAADPFFSRIQNGIDQAAEDMGVEVDFRAPDTFDMVEMGRLIEAAAASEPDGLVVSIADEDALEDPIRQAVDAGIPVVAINSGREVYKDLGILSYVGQLEYEAGVEAGERMANEGVDNAVCINQDVGVYTLEQRCEGFAEGLGGQVETVAVDTTDPSGARSRVQNYVRQNEDINGMMGLGSTAGEAAIDAAAALDDRDIQVATFDLSPSILRAISDGDMLFTVDQQQYLQGYLPVVMLTLYSQYGTMPQNEVQTGPAFVTQENAEEVLELSEADIR